MISVFQDTLTYWSSGVIQVLLKDRSSTLVDMTVLGVKHTQQYYYKPNTNLTIFIGCS